MRKLAGGVARVLLGFVIIWLVLDRSAALLESFRGEAGIIVCLLVLLAAVAVERLLFRTPFQGALGDLGFRVPTAASLAATLVLSAALLAFFPLYAWFAGVPVALVDGWYWLVPGLFAQGGIAEEVLFRGFVFRHLREGRSFWRAAALSALPFVAVHLILFATLPFAVAAASLALSVSLAFPLAWLFERAGNSVWPPAIVHFVVQGAIKLVAAPEPAFQTLAVMWIAVVTVLPWALFALRPRPDR